MQFLALARRRTDQFSEEQFAQLLGPEAEAVRKLYAAGTVRQVFSRGDVLGAVLLLECPDAASAQALMDGLPLGQKGMLEVQLVPLAPYRGFS